jgi:hypothetical protein
VGPSGGLDAGARGKSFPVGNRISVVQSVVRRNTDRQVPCRLILSQVAFGVVLFVKKMSVEASKCCK